jgi:hypothetical protein
MPSGCATKRRQTHGTVRLDAPSDSGSCDRHYAASGYEARRFLDLAERGGKSGPLFPQSNPFDAARAVALFRYGIRHKYYGRFPSLSIINDHFRATDTAVKKAKTAITKTP